MIMPKSLRFWSFEDLLRPLRACRLGNSALVVVALVVIAGLVVVAGLFIAGGHLVVVTGLVIITGFVGVSDHVAAGGSLVVVAGGSGFLPLKNTREHGRNSLLGSLLLVLNDHARLDIFRALLHFGVVSSSSDFVGWRTMALVAQSRLAHFL